MEATPTPPSRKRPRDKGKTPDSQRRRLGPGSTRAGIIEFLQLKNILCHRNKLFNFSPRINWICGENGSGKSAVMVGLQVALGATARFTSRGSSIRDLVTAGQPSGTIRLGICNKMPDSFEHEIYGDRIIVERHIPVRGSPTYKLISSVTKKTVSTRKDDLNIILDHFNIQINPSTFYNQGDSLLEKASKDDGSFYGMVMDATLLKKAIDNLLELNGHIQQMIGGLDIKKGELPDLEEKVKRGQQAVNGLEKIDKYHREILEFKAKLAWRKVQDAEDEREDVRKKLDKSTKMLGEAKRKSENAEAKMQEIRVKQAELITVVAELTAEVDANRQKFNETKRRMEEVGTELKKVEKKKLERNRDMKRASNHIDRLNADIRTIRAEQDKAKRGGDDRRIEIERLERDIVERQRELNDATRELDTVRQSVNPTGLAILQDASNRAKQSVRDLNDMVRKERSTVSSLQSKVPIDQFQYKATQLARSIKQNEHRFNRIPIGPLGAHVHVTDPRVAYGVEQMLGPVGGYYICDTQANANLVLELASKLGIKRLNTLTMPLDRPRHNIPASDAAVPPDRGDRYVRAMDVLDFDNDCVFNAVEDARSMSHVVFAFDMLHGRRLAHDKSKGKSISEAFVVEGSSSTRLFTRGDTQGEVVLRGGTGKYHTDMAVKRQAAENRLESAEQQLEQNKQIALNAEEEYQQKRRAAEGDRRRLVQMEKRVSKLEETLDDVEAHLNELRDSEGDATALDDTFERIQQKEQDIDDTKEQMVSLRQEMDKIDDAVKQLKARRQLLHDQAQAEVEDELEGRLEQLESELQIVGRDIVEQERKKKRADEYHRRFQTEFDERTAMNMECERNINTAIHEAQEVSSERQSSRMTVKQLALQIQGHEESIRIQERHQGGSAEELRNVLRHAVESFEAVKNLIEQNSQLIKDLGDREEERKREFKQARRNTYYCLGHMFGQIVGKFQYGGSIESDHVNGSLKMLLTSKSTGQNIDDIKTLSGGERSVTMVAFMLALWDICNAPIYCWDEYEKMMDDSNRDKATKAILTWIQEKAKSGTHPQLILLSPRNSEVVDDTQNADWITVTHLRKESV